MTDGSDISSITDRLSFALAIVTVPITIALVYFFLESEPCRSALKGAIPNRQLRTFVKSVIIFLVVFIILIVVNSDRAPVAETESE